MEDYLKAVDLLTINGNEQKLSREVEELKGKSKYNEFIIREDLEEKDKEIQLLKQHESYNADAIITLSEQVRKLTEQMEIIRTK